MVSMLLFFLEWATRSSKTPPVKNTKITKVMLRAKAMSDAPERPKL